MKVATIEDMMADYRNGVYNFCEDGKCIGCGNCCSRILPMSQKEIDTIHKYIKKHGIGQQKHVFNFLAKPIIDMTCPFLDDSKPKNKCVIYDVRPQICRDFKCDNMVNGKKCTIPSSVRIKLVDVTEEFFGG